MMTVEATKEGPKVTQDPVFVALLRKLLVGKELSNGCLDQLKTLPDTGQMVLYRIRSTPPEERQHELDQVCEEYSLDSEGLWLSIGEVTPVKQELPSKKTQKPTYLTPYVPALPMTARVNPADAKDAGKFLSVYEHIAGQVVKETYQPFHTAIGLWLASTVIARRVAVEREGDPLFPNLFVLIIARSTLFHKTSCMNVARGVLREVAPQLLLEERSTPEGLRWNLSGSNPPNWDKLNLEQQNNWEEKRRYAAQRSLAVDEFSSMMSTAGRDYMSGYLELLWQLYDCVDEQSVSTKTDGLTSFKNAYLSLLAASTPRMMKAFLLDDKLWNNGHWPRFGLIVPDCIAPTRVRRDPKCPPKKIDTSAITSMLRKVQSRLPQAKYPDYPEPVLAELTPEAWEVLSNYGEGLLDIVADNLYLDENIGSAYGRLEHQAVKIATILATCDWADIDLSAPVVEHKHAVRAVLICEEWRASLHRAVAQAQSTDTRIDSVLEKVFENFSKLESEGRNTAREVGRKLNMKTQDVVAAAEVLVEMGRLISRIHKPSTGRPTTFYERPKDEDGEVVDD